MIFFILALLINPIEGLENQDDIKSEILKYSERKTIFDNFPPEKPNIVSGVDDGEIGEEYIYIANSIDPDGDDIYYLIDWGDGFDSGWIGPYYSGDNANFCHSWKQKGNYNIRVRAKDTNDQLSEWSDFYEVIIHGPYIEFKEITGGLGLKVEIQNNGDRDANNIKLNIETSGGIFFKILNRNFEISSVPAGESAEIRLITLGFGMGLLNDFPSIKIGLNHTYASNIVKRVTTRIVGPFVKKVGEYWCNDESFNGYTLYSPMMSTSTFLINNSGDVVHSWQGSYKPALSVYLLENGNILRTACHSLNPNFWGGGLGGRVEIFDWENNLIWAFEYSNSTHCLHHDVEMLPNGNILMIAWELKTSNEAIEAGRDPSSLAFGELWPNHIIEVEPTGSFGGNIVWEWHLWDHLIQDFDPTKGNYGVVEDHPELIDINYYQSPVSDWNHVNSIDYNEDFDQILICSRTFSEIWVIDHSTTIQEAAGHTGGNSGKGGDILYRWGNPQVYRAGDENDQMLFGPHDAQWIEEGKPGEGNILIFNNGLGRFQEEYSSVDEIVPPVNGNGVYNLETENSYGPEELIWSYYDGQNPVNFYALNLAGAQRMPNGNTIICDGPHGIFFEVTAENEIVWEYKNQVPSMFDCHVFKVRRYAPNYPGLENLFS